MTPNSAIGKGRLWCGRILRFVVAAFMLMDAVMKLMKPAMVVKTTTELGYPESSIAPLGLALMIGALMYIVPRTSVIGAIIICGYLGGAVDANLHAGKPLSNILFPVVFGVLAWVALVLESHSIERVTFGGTSV